MRRKDWLLSIVGIAAAACQSSAGMDLPPLPNRVGEGRGGAGGAAALTIKILAPPPMAVIRPNVPTEVQVQVPRISNGPATVEALLQQMPDGAARHLVLAGPTAEDVWNAPLDLAGLPSGSYQLTVTATTSTGASSKASVVVTVDPGPFITVESPQKGKAYKGGMPVRVLVDSKPFAPTDKLQAFIGPMEVSVPRTAVADPARSGSVDVYEGTVQFESDSFRSNPLAGDQVFKVLATSKNGNTSELDVPFTVDRIGPSITATEPAEGQVVGGIITIRAKVTDPFGVVSSTVVAFVGNRGTPEFRVELKPEGDPTVFSALFDTKNLTRCNPTPDTSLLCHVFPTLSFRAQDMAGNESVVAYQIGIDNQPPFVDLSSSTEVRVRRYDRQMDSLTCSHAFNPLGGYNSPGDVPGDLCAAPQVFSLRARIEDSGNFADGLKFPPIAGIDPATTALYVLPDTTQALVVDVDGDGWCDTINPKLVPTTKGPVVSNEVLAIRLAAVPPKGVANFTPDNSLLLPPANELYRGCNKGTGGLAPSKLCGGESLSVVIGYPTARGPNAAIWALEPITAGEPQCVGSQFDAFANNIPENRWVCIAAAAKDKLGNMGVSSPLRVWIQYRGPQLTDPQKCAASSLRGGPPPPPPDCTGIFDRKTESIGGSCKGRVFPAWEVIDEGALPEGM